MGVFGFLGRQVSNFARGAGTALGSYARGGSLLGSAVKGADRAFSGPQSRPGPPALPGYFAESSLPTFASSLTGGPAERNRQRAILLGKGDPFAVQANARGSYAAPRFDMAMIEQLKAAGLFIGNADLRGYLRSPSKKHVVVHVQQDGATLTFALEKQLAKKWGLWKAQSKPPITAGEMNAIRKASRAISKFQGVEKAAKKIANWRSPRPQSRPVVAQLPGKNIVVTGRRVK